MLTKSNHLKAIQCQKLLWLTKHKKEVLTPQKNSAQSKLKIGTEVGELACKLFPNGQQIEYNAQNFQGMVEQTKQWIEEGVQTIYEATFMVDGLFIMVDILTINSEGLTLYEVKSSTGVKDIYLHDVAFQYYVVEKLGYHIENAFVIHLDSSYVFDETLDLESLFKVVNVTEEVKTLQKEIPLNIEISQNYLAHKEDEPNIEIGKHCHKPYLCEAKEYCWKVQRNIPDYSIFNIFHLGSKKQIDLYEQGIVKVEDIPDDYELTKRQRHKVKNFKEKKEYIDSEQIEKFVASLSYPLYYLDFETFQQAIPQWQGVSPYRQIPFQYSLHIEEENGALEHKEFLAKEGEDPRESFAQSLVENIPEDVMVLGYNMSFEKGVLRKLAKEFDAFSDHLMAIHDNLVDLMMPFQKGYYLTPSMQGSYSIKYVLPALVPHMSDAYEDLELINSGSEAMDAFAQLNELDEVERVATRKALLAYCRLDTLAMVEILRVLRDRF